MTKKVGGPAVTVTCLRCQGQKSIRSKTRLPHGWKRLGGPLCVACLRSAYVQRSVVIPVSYPLDGRTWVEFGHTLKTQWAEATRGANWLLTTLYTRDVRRAADDTTLREMPSGYLYPELRTVCPQIAPINLTTLIRSMEKTYRQQRYELLWTGQRSLATIRYPAPIPLHQQGWQLAQQEDGAWVVRVRLGPDGEWWRLRLTGGPAFHRQLGQLRQLASGIALPGAGAIYRQVRRLADHRSGSEDRGQRTRVLVKLVGWFPKRDLASDVTGTLAIATESSDLMAGRIHARGEVFRFHGDYLRRAIGQYETERHRIAADLGVLRRWIPAERAALTQRMDAIAARQRRRGRTWHQQIGAAIVRVARREHVRTVQYADEEDGFCYPFPWTQLRLAVQSAVEAAGLQWEYASGAVNTETTDSLAVTETPEVST